MPQARDSEIAIPGKTVFRYPKFLHNLRLWDALLHKSIYRQGNRPSNASIHHPPGGVSDVGVVCKIFCRLGLLRHVEVVDLCGAAMRRGRREEAQPKIHITPGLIE